MTRLLAPELEGQVKHVLKKRKQEPEEGGDRDGERKVARKLDFGR